MMKSRLSLDTVLVWKQQESGRSEVLLMTDRRRKSHENDQEQVLTCQQEQRLLAQPSPSPQFLAGF